MKEISIKSATYFSAVAKYSTVVVNLLVTAILSRILSPEDYGILAIATIFTNFFAILSEMGIGPAVVQNRNLTEDEIDDIFSFTVFAGLTLGAAFQLLSVPISLFFDNNVYYRVCAILSVQVFFNTINMVPSALLYRSNEFRLIALRTVTVLILTSGVSIGLALGGWKYYAVLIQSVLSAILVFAWNYKGVHLRFRFNYNRSSITKIREYSSYQFLFSVVNYFSRNIDNILIGKMLGDVQLAYYDKSYKLMMYPISNLTFVINPVLHPILAVHQDDRNYIYQKYISVLKVLSLIGAYVTPVLFFSSREVICIMYGDQWGESVSCFRILSISIWFQMLASSAGGIYQSLNRTKLMFESSLVHVPITILLITCGIWVFGTIDKVAVCVTISYIIKFFVEFYCLVKLGFGLKMKEFLRNFSLDAFTMVVVFVVGAAAFSSTFLGNLENTSAFLSLAAKGLFCFMIFAVQMAVTGRWKNISMIIKRRN